jgi:hypothetical protein
MRWGVLILLGVFFVSFASAVIPGDCDNDGNMVAYWQFGNDVLDSYSSYDLGYWTGTANYGVSMVGNGLSFSGTEIVTIPNVPASAFTSAFTTEMWIDVGSFSAASFFKKGNYEIGWVDLGSTTGLVSVVIGGVAINSSAISSSSPHHVAVVWDSSASNLILYVDGTVENNAVLASAGTVSGNLIVGEGFVGLIDELAIYSSDLSGGVVALHHALGVVAKDYCDVSGTGGSSSTKTVFNIRGCNFDIGGGNTFGVASGMCSGSPYDGEFFCSDDQEAFVTNEWGLGCAMGDSSYDVNNNNDFCCPVGNFCNESEAGGTFRCDRRSENCFDQGTEAECNTIGCIWLDVEGICVDGVRDYDCGYYDTEADCNTDEWNLGKVGIGTELCGTTIECNGETFSVPEADCSCAWFASAPLGQECQVSLVGVQMFYDPAASPDKFACSNIYSLGTCTDGEQNVTWSSNSSVVSGFGGASAVPVDCLDALNCNGGEGTRFCGEPIIKLPGFSLFAFFASLFIVGMFYFVKERR